MLMDKNATNSSYMKLSNRRLILNIVRKKPASRAELAKMTGLTRAAVTLIVEELIKDGILMETGTAEADYGRKPVLLDLEPHNNYAVGVSVARDGCNVGLMNIKGVLLDKHQVTIDGAMDAYEIIAAIIEKINKIMADSSLPAEKFLGIGINTPGPVDIKDGRVLNPPNFDLWHNVNIVTEFKKSFPFNVFLENNATALALAEKNYGRGAEFGSFMLMVVDAGIGAGIVINDRIYRGVGGFGSEVGHTSIDINGKACSCGNRGCLEVYASIPSALKKIQGQGKNIKTWDELVDKASDGDGSCMELIGNEALYLSAGIVNAMNILELEAVILTGTIQYRPELLLELIRKNVENTAITRHIHKLQIMDSSILKDSEIISAAAVVFEKYFNGEAAIGPLNQA